jgi:hypothetical protein
MSSPTEFYLTALDNNISVLKALIEAEDASQDTNANPKAIAKLEVSVADVRDIFQFATNSVDLTDISSEDMYFFVDANKFRDLKVSTDSYSVNVNGSALPGSIEEELLVDQIGRAYVFDVKNTAGKQGLNFENDVKGNEYTVDNKGMIKDLFRDLANQMFNTQYGVDIFSNETDLCNNVYTNTSALLRAADGATAAGAIWQALDDASGLHYVLENPNQAGNIGQVLFENIVTNDVARLQSLDSADYVSTQDLQTANNAAGDGAAAQNNNEMRMYKMPFIVGDSIRFHLTYQYDGDQSLVVGGSGAYLDRIYEVRLDLV